MESWEGLGEGDCKGFGVVSSESFSNSSTGAVAGSCVSILISIGPLSCTTCSMGFVSMDGSAVFELFESMLVLTVSDSRPGLVGPDGVTEDERLGGRLSF